MAITSVAPLVRKYFEEHPGEEVKPGPLTRWVEQQRGLAEDQQSAGAVRAAIGRAWEAGWVERLDGAPLRYKYKPDGSTSPPASTPPPPEPAIPPPPRKPVEKFYRPNKEQYFPRHVGDHRDIDVLRNAMKGNLFILLYGPPGAGKTALVEAAFPHLITMSGDADTSVPDITGDFVRIPEDKDDDDAWADGPLVEAMTADGGRGCPLFIDDATLIAPGVMSVIYPAMDGRRQISVKSRPPKLGRVVKAGTEFYIIAAHNPGVPGAILSEALSSRFTIQIEVTTDYNLARSQGVNPKAITVANNLETNRKNDQMSWAPQMRDLLAFRENEKTFGTAFACSALIAAAPEGEDRKTAERQVTSTFGVRAAALILGGQV